MGTASRGRVVSYDDVLTAATRLFVETATVDMQQLAESIPVSRATLYRVAPGRDRVLGDVVWSFGQQHHDTARAAVDGEGLDRIILVLRRFGETIQAQRAFRGFITTETDVAARVLFTPAGGVHERFVAANKVLIRESTSGPDALPFDLDTTAYVLSRIYESMWYADLLSGRDPDLDVADRTARAVLTAG